MGVGKRFVSLPSDSSRIFDFLETQYSSTRQYSGGAWLAPVWEDNGRIVAVALYELGPGEAFLFSDRNYAGLADELVRHAESELSVADGSDTVVSVFVPESESELRSAVLERGFERDGDGDRPMAVYAVPQEIPAGALPQGFRISSLAENNDLGKLDRVLWRGFGHEGEPPSERVRTGRRS